MNYSYSINRTDIHALKALIDISAFSALKSCESNDSSHITERYLQYEICTILGG